LVDPIQEETRALVQILKNKHYSPRPVNRQRNLDKS
jgi:hypothetical protein